ncbi:MAG: DUF3800 domain-containing protein [Victivallaceae bacterium]
MYLFYIDESGNRDLEHLERERFYVLASVGMFERRWKKFHFEIENVKKGILKRINDDYGLALDLSRDTEVKSTYLRNPNARKNHPFSLFQTDFERKTLSDAFFEQIEEIKAIVIAVVIDKRYIDNRLSSQLELHNKAWELLCERIESFMQEKHDKHKAILITDDTGLQNNLAAAKHQSDLYRRGASSGLRMNHIIEMPLFVSSQTNAGVQLADICAYNIYRRFKDDLPEYDFFVRIRPFIYKSLNTAKGKLDGLKVFPNQSEFA